MADSKNYGAEAIEVLEGLDPVRKRPGMYTDTSRPNHLAQEVIDNSVDEALAGHARPVQVILHQDNSLEVIDDGRGMPVDIHPEEGVPAVELILCRLHAGGKFSSKNYQFSGGLHGVGISVVNALSKRVEVTVRRNGEIYQIAFENGDKVQDASNAPNRLTDAHSHRKPKRVHQSCKKLSPTSRRFHHSLACTDGVPKPNICGSFPTSVL